MRIKIQGPSTLFKSPHILSFTLKISSVGENLRHAHKRKWVECENERLTNQCLQVAMSLCVEEGTVTQWPVLA